MSKCSPIDPSGYQKIFMHNGNIMLSTQEECFKLNHGVWMKHSDLVHKRHPNASVVTTNIATFFFGGFWSRDTYEYLPHDSNEWMIGQTKIPGGLKDGFAIAVKSGQEIWLIGGFDTEKRILSFNVNDHSFKELPINLIVERWGHNCAFIPGTNKVMITGGGDEKATRGSNSSEILDIETGVVTLANPMNRIRLFHGMGTTMLDGENRVVVFSDNRIQKAIEFYDTKAKKWKITNQIKMRKEMHVLNYLTLNLWEIQRLFSKPDTPR